jgi:hypothetical protein
LWLGHSNLATTEVYTRGDPTEKLEAIEAIVPPHLRKGSFRPPDKLIAMLSAKSRYDSALHPRRHQRDRRGDEPARSSARPRRCRVIRQRSLHHPICGLAHRVFANRWFFEFTTYALVSRLRASWMLARATKAPRVSLVNLGILAEICLPTRDAE